MTNPLFQPFTLGSMKLRNRIVMAPMTRSFSPDGIPTDDVAAYYERRAEADVGLLVTEGTTVHRGGASFDAKIPKFHDEAPLAAWGKVVERVHAKGGAIAPQIWHVGLARKPGTGPYPDAPSDSPSGMTHDGKLVAPVLSDEDVADIVSAFANAAGEAGKLGFDSVELHGAHGYLIDQFFWSEMNKRDGQYGGDLIERSKFAADIIRECKKQMPDDMPLIIRVSQWKQQNYASRLAHSPDELSAFLGHLVDAGVDILHCSQRRYWEPEFEGSDLNFAGWAKKLTGVPTISVGSVGLSGDFFGAFAGQGAGAAPLDNLLERMDKGEFDMIAVGRALLQDPLWAQKIKENRLDELEDYSGESIKTLY